MLAKPLLKQHSKALAHGKMVKYCGSKIVRAYVKLYVEKEGEREGEIKIEDI